jgi:hypothetical protein
MSNVMPDRVMPPPDRYATCPYGGRILEYYSGAFDAVFVLLSPFLRPARIPLERFAPGTWPDRREICASCTTVSWETIRRSAGLPSIAAVDVALRTRILGLKAEFANVAYAERLEQVLDREGLIAPTEGEHPDLLHNAVLDLFAKLGHTWVWVGDEFCSERKLHWIEDLKNETGKTIEGHCNVFSPDKTLLWTVHWDSHFSFLCGAGRTLEDGHVADRFEGFFCQAPTEVYWSVEA